MDLFKNIKDLKIYSRTLSELFENITLTGIKVKIGKFRIIETPSEDAAERLYNKLRTAVESELIEVKTMYDKIENTLKTIQVDLFKDNEVKDNAKI